MTEAEVDALIYNTFASPEGRLFHAWLVNNYLLTVSRTVDPQEALVQNAQSALVSGLNSRYARHLEKVNNAASPKTTSRRKRKPDRET